MKTFRRCIEPNSQEQLPAGVVQQKPKLLHGAGSQSLSDCCVEGSREALECSNFSGCAFFVE